MPRFASIVFTVLAGCWFDAHYTSGQVTCEDGYCPIGLACNTVGVCVTPMGHAILTDASIDALPDAPFDGKTPAALTCADPGSFIADATVTGTTASRSNTITAVCGGSVMNGRDAVYKIAGTLGQQVTLTPTSSDFPITAYVITPCAVEPATPSCVDNAYATGTTPITVTIPATTDYFIVVDDVNPAQSGAYSLTVALH